MTPRSEGLVYYALDANRNSLRVKIGTTTDLWGRLRSLTPRTMSRQAPLVLALEEGGHEREAERHAQFRAHRMMGEWFEYEQDLLTHLASMAHPVGWLADNPELWTYANGWQGFVGWKGTRLPEIELDGEFPPVDPSVPVNF